MTFFDVFLPIPFLASPFDLHRCQKARRCPEFPLNSFNEHPRAHPMRTHPKSGLRVSVCSFSSCRPMNQGALKGTNLRGQTEPKCRFSQIFADSRIFLENNAFGKRRFSKIFADFCRRPQKPAENRGLAFVPLGPRFVPLSAAPIKYVFGRQRPLPKTCVLFHENDSSSLLKCLTWMVASVVKGPSMIRVTLLCGRVLSGMALWRVLIYCRDQNYSASLKCFQELISEDRKRGQKSSKIFSTLFDIFRAGQKRSKIAKKCQKKF